MLAGKVFGTVCAAMLQFALWTAALLGGFLAGAEAVRWINPRTDMISGAADRIPEPVQRNVLSGDGPFWLWESFWQASCFTVLWRLWEEPFSSKPEDLSNANILFILALLISFFAVLGSSGFGEQIPVWLDWIPFTAVLVVPGQILTGAVGTGGRSGNPGGWFLRRPSW